MKSIFYTFLLLTVFSFQTTHAQEIPNGSFDDWISYDLFDTPPPYLNVNLQTYLAAGVASVSQVAGTSGSAVRLETYEIDGDLIPGFIGLIDPDAQDLGGGIAFSSNPDSVRMDLRYELNMQDTAGMTLIFTAGTTPVGFAQVIITGEQTDFATFTFDIPPILGTPDSLIFFATSSAADTPIEGGFIEIDNIEFISSNDQLPNADFEIWNEIGYEDPENWSSPNILQTIFEFEPVVMQTNDAIAGSAIRIETVETYNFDDDELDTLGYIASGDFLNDGEPSIELDVSPQQISGYYKYIPVGNDSATIYLDFTKFDPSSGFSETVAEYAFKLGEASEYTIFSFDLAFNEIPDSAFIGITSFNLGDGFANEAPLGSVLYIDELTFGLLDGTKMPILSDALKVYPNPANDFIYIKTEEIVGTPYSIILTDISGRTIEYSNLESLSVGENLIRLNTSRLNTGMYTYKILSDKNHYAGKVMIQKE